MRAGRKQEDNGIGNVPVPLLTTLPVMVCGNGKLVTVKTLVSEGVKFPETLNRYVPTMFCMKSPLLKFSVRGDLPGRRVRVAGHIEIGHPANHHARLAVLQIKLLHQPISAINDAVGVERRDIFAPPRSRRRQAGYLERDGAVLSVADGGWRDVERDGGERVLVKGSQRCECHTKADEESFHKFDCVRFQ